MKFNSLKLQEELKLKRVIKDSLNYFNAAREAGVSPHQYTRAEKYGNMDIDVFTKLVGWLGTNPDDYFTELTRPRLTTKDYQDIVSGLIIAMKTLDDLKMDQALSDRLEKIDDKIRIFSLK